MVLFLLFFGHVFQVNPLHRHLVCLCFLFMKLIKKHNAFLSLRFALPYPYAITITIKSPIIKRILKSQEHGLGINMGKISINV